MRRDLWIEKFVYHVNMFFLESTIIQTFFLSALKLKLSFALGPLYRLFQIGITVASTLTSLTRMNLDKSSHLYFSFKYPFF